MSLLKEIEPIKTKDFLQEKFREYYKSANITLPPRFTSREWGFLNWGGGVMNRHVRFGSIHEVNNYLKKMAPAHSYHSVAYYEEPGSRAMIEKKWQGADLIFDLDADHLPEMEEVKKGKITFLKLMEYIREQTFRLVNDVLLGDFGLDEKVESLTEGVAGLLFDPEKTSEKAKETLAEAEKAILALENQQAGFRLSILALDEKTAEEQKKITDKVTEDAIKAARARE